MSRRGLALFGILLLSGQAVEPQEKASLRIGLSFDDGSAGEYSNAWKVMKERGLRARFRSSPKSWDTAAGT